MCMFMSRKTVCTLYGGDVCAMFLVTKAYFGDNPKGILTDGCVCGKPFGGSFIAFLWNALNEEMESHIR